MKEEYISIIQNRLLKAGNPDISIQITGAEVFSILEAVYRKGREDSEREIREAIVKREAEEYITKAEAMQILGKSETTLWKWNRVGYLPCVKHGGTVMYKRSDVMDIRDGQGI